VRDDCYHPRDVCNRLTEAHACLPCATFTACYPAGNHDHLPCSMIATVAHDCLPCAYSRPLTRRNTSRLLTLRDHHPQQLLAWCYAPATYPALRSRLLAHSPCALWQKSPPLPFAPDSLPGSGTWRQGACPLSLLSGFLLAVSSQAAAAAQRPFGGRACEPNPPVCSQLPCRNPLVGLRQASTQAGI
jgi:hypothetical protein